MHGAKQSDIIDSINLNLIVQEVAQIAIKGGEFIKEQFGKVNSTDIVTKEINSLVSYVDITTEKMTVEALSKLIPEAGFITEEGTIEQGNPNIFWIIDPLDGTTNYLSGLPVFSVSIALCTKKDILLGVVYDVMHDWCFTAVKGKGTLLNDKSIYISEEPALSKSIIATGFPYDQLTDESILFEIFKRVVQNARGIRRMGSAAIDLAYVACGKFEAFYETTLNAWDMAAGILLVKEAGGKVTDFMGKDDMLINGSIIAASPNIHEEVLDIISTAGFEF